VAKSSKNVLEAVLNNIYLVKKLRQVISQEEPEVMISFMDRTNILCILASIFKDVPLLISERNSPERKGIGSYWRLLRKILYPFSDCLIVQNASIAEWFKRKICKARLKVIPNPAPAIIEPHCDRQSYSFIKILAVGSNLSYQKGFDLLLAAYDPIAKKYPHCKLVIAGEGENRLQLEEFIKDNSLEKNVDLPGRIQDIYSELKSADIFVLSSRYEGSPNALIEAMAAGCACVAFDCQYGPRDLIQHSKNGLLVSVGNVAGLTEAIDYLILHPQIAQAMGKAAVHSVQTRFHVSQVAEQWLETIEDIV